MSKKAKSKFTPKSKEIVSANPDAFYSENPSWCFNSCDKEYWQLEKHAFWSELLPKFKGLETQHWQEILVTAKKENHQIDVSLLNKKARDRLNDLCIEAEAIMSIRLQGTHRLYGYMQKSVFCVLWYDTNHGDNDECVCRSRKKHT